MFTYVSILERIVRPCPKRLSHFGRLAGVPIVRVSLADDVMGPVQCLDPRHQNRLLGIG
jgi:hypothetical protein